MKDKSQMDNLITEALQSAPEFNLTDSFADAIATKAYRKYSMRTMLIEYLLYFGIILGLLLVAAGLFVFLNRDNLQQILNTLSENMAIIISVAFTLNFILFADKVLLRVLFLFKR